MPYVIIWHFYLILFCHLFYFVFFFCFKNIFVMLIMLVNNCHEINMYLFFVLQQIKPILRFYLYYIMSKYFFVFVFFFCNLKLSFFTRFLFFEKGFFLYMNKLLFCLSLSLLYIYSIYRFCMFCILVYEIKI